MNNLATESQLIEQILCISILASIGLYFLSGVLKDWQKCYEWKQNNIKNIEFNECIDNKNSLLEISENRKCQSTYSNKLYSDCKTKDKNCLVALDDGDNGTEWMYTTKQNADYLYE